LPVHTNASSASFSTCCGNWFAKRAARSAPDDWPKNASFAGLPDFSITAMAAFRSSTPLWMSELDDVRCEWPYPS